MAKIKVLLVDDASVVISLEKMMLGGEGFEIFTANNGEEALGVLENEKPDVILLDIMMPVLDGIETLRRIRSNEGTKEIPVIMVTTKGEPEKVETCYEIGCNDYITKPFDKMNLISKIKSVLTQ